MMMLPTVFDDNFFDDFTEPMERRFFGNRNSVFGRQTKNLMKTDIKENENDYEIDVDLPGFAKEDISLSLEDGYLTVSAEKKEENEKNDANSGYLHRERWYGSCSRSYYVGSAVTNDDIKAKMENGILHMNVLKKAPALPEKNFIAIE